MSCSTKIRARGPVKIHTDHAACLAVEERGKGGGGGALAPSPASGNGASSVRLLGHAGSSSYMLTCTVLMAACIQRLCFKHRHVDADGVKKEKERKAMEQESRSKIPLSNRESARGH